MGIREAARWVEEDSGGAVTSKRAKRCYENRAPGPSGPPRKRSQKRVWKTILGKMGKTNEYLSAWARKGAGRPCVERIPAQIACVERHTKNMVVEY